MDERAAMIAAGIRPGNMGGETLREYCGLSRRLVIAVRRHQERAGGEKKGGR